jgi:hypothetical protein
MKGPSKHYEELVIVPKVWEQIIYKGEKHMVLVSEPVSAYIRELEDKING